MRWISLSLALRRVLSLGTIIAIAVVLASCSGKKGMVIEPLPLLPGPDLVVTSVVPSPRRVTVGDSIRLTATIRNRGDQGAGTTVATFYRSTDPTISPQDIPIGTEPIKALTTGESVNAQTTDSAAEVGRFYYGACVESVRDETDTRNNCSTGAPVDVMGGPAPELVVSNFNVTPRTANGGERFRLQATVRNSGQARSPSTTLRYYASSDRSITTRDTQIGTDSVGSLRAGGTSDESISETAPLGGNYRYYYGACVDPVQGEDRTNNNCSSGVEVTVTQPQLFGALALTTGSVCPEYGVAVANYTDRASAEAAARRICESTYDVGCVTNSFDATCGAVVYGSGFVNFLYRCSLYRGYGNTRGAAEQDALNQCARTYNGCTVRDWACSSR